jgi:hypothetical protein
MRARSIFAVLIILFAVQQAASQKTFFSLSRYERRWALFHPFAACRIKKHQQEMYGVYEEVKKSGMLDAYESGGRLDAFRHAFAMAYFVRFVRPARLRKLGKAHEKGNYEHFKKGITEEGELPDSAATVMDLKNNELGILIGCQNGRVAIQELRLKVIEKIKSGAAVILRRDADGRYTDCNGRALAPEELKGKWQNQKCLVASS